MDSLAALLDQMHKSHYNSIKLSCKTGLSHELLPEIDFSDPQTRIYVEAYLVTKENIH